jgi:hypothetical protein
LIFDFVWSCVVITDLLALGFTGIAVACESFYDDAWMRGDEWIGSGLLRGTSGRSTRSGDEKSANDGWLYLYHIASSMTTKT